MKELRQRSIEKGFDNLARVVRNWSDRPGNHGPVVSPLMASGRGNDARGIASRRDLSSGRRRPLVVTACAGVAVALLMVLRGFGHSGGSLSFVVAEGRTASGQSSQGSDSVANGTVTSGAQPARMTFSDGSDVVLQPGARGTVVGTTTRGARVRLETGRARFAVAHRPRTDWSVEAGPFVVRVHGTIFDVSWSAQTGVLTVDLIAGAVTVESRADVLGASGGPTSLRAGQRLTARAASGERLIGPIGPIGAPVVEALAPPIALASMTAAPTPIVVPSALPDMERPDVGQSDQLRRTGSESPRGRGAGHHVARSAATLSEVATNWSARVASGSFRSVVAEADEIGVERCLSQAPMGALGALADAARYVRRTDLARRALLAERRRFAGTAVAHDAAFLIGRLADDAGGDAREALVWYDRYLEEGAHGTYAAEALGRKMLALARVGEEAEARGSAARYLEAYPRGAFAHRAKQLLESR